jgi:hypothetical protein
MRKRTALGVKQTERACVHGAEQTRWLRGENGCDSERERTQFGCVADIPHPDRVIRRSCLVGSGVSVQKNKHHERNKVKIPVTAMGVTELLPISSMAVMYEVCDRSDRTARRPASMLVCTQCRRRKYDRQFCEKYKSIGTSMDHRSSHLNLSVNADVSE